MSNKLRIASMTGRDIYSYLFLAFLMLVYFAMFLLIHLVGFVAIIFIFIVIAAMLLFAITQPNLRLSIFWFTLFLSAIQNVVLGMLVYELTGQMLKVVLVMNFIEYFILFIFVFMLSLGRGALGFPINYLVIIALVCAASMVVMHSEINAAVASFRDVTAMYLYFTIGWFIAKYGRLTSISGLKFGLILLVFFIFSFGVAERFLDQNLWRSLNITQLWLQKGLNVQPNGFPGNFYAAERLNGEYIRRMVSSYADPINLGTNLFLFFVLGWYFRAYYISILCFVMILCAISKGAIMGVMLFFLFFLRVMTFCPSPDDGSHFPIQPLHHQRRILLIW